MKKCIIWGAGKYAKENYLSIIKAGFNLVGFCDSEPDKQNELIGDYEVYSVEKAAELCRDDSSIIIILGVYAEGTKREIRNTIAVGFPDGTECVTVFDALNPDWKEKEQYYYNKMQYKWETDITSGLQIWIDGIDSELSYWMNSVFSKTGLFHDQYERIRKDQIDLSKRRFSQMINLSDKTILDVGCGLMSEYASIGGLVPVDAMAPFYNIINSTIKDGYKEDYRCTFGMFEFLSYYMGCDSVDVIHISNALDHSLDPFKSLVECLKVVKKGGVIFLKHRRAVAIYENWRGLHQWNLDIINGNFVIWGKDNAVNISEELSEYADISVETYGDESRDTSYLFITIKKTNEIEDNTFFSKEDDGHALAVCVEALFGKLAENSCPKYL